MKILGTHQWNIDSICRLPICRLPMDCRPIRTNMDKLDSYYKSGSERVVRIEAY